MTTITKFDQDVDTSFDMASTFLHRLTGDDSVPVTFQTFDDRKSDKRPELTRVLHGTLGQHLNELKQMNNQGRAILDRLQIWAGFSGR